uniref:Uncharacterized protein n=1 Tax=Amphora coffeiformis TaxID=265554 RepID=A0A7S3P8J6_9STRA|mmetsp:Transcript_23914/g.45508  ORF Transcript_23914/g.45508 Transcript_23914/m.45508 type:complete len:348 (+) Transcript_23914:57-1100(+)
MRTTIVFDISSQYMKQHLRKGFIMMKTGTAFLWATALWLTMTMPSAYAVDSCNGVYCPATLTFLPTAAASNPATGQTTTCELLPAEIEAEGIITDCSIIQSLVVAAGCCELLSTIGSGGGAGNPCERCADFTPDAIVVGADTESCGEAFPLSSFDAVEEGTAVCLALEGGVELAGCCASSTGTQGDPCTLCPQGDDDFTPNETILGDTKTCGETISAADFISSNQGSAICDAQQSAVVIQGCCASNDEGCLSELSDFVQCINDNPDCADTCDSGVDTDSNEPAQGDICNFDGVDTFRSCCSQCASLAETYFECACDGNQNSAGFTTRISFVVAMLLGTVATVAMGIW